MTTRDNHGNESRTYTTVLKKAEKVFQDVIATEGVEFANDVLDAIQDNLKLPAAPVVGLEATIAWLSRFDHKDELTPCPGLTPCIAWPAEDPRTSALCARCENESRAAERPL